MKKILIILLLLVVAVTAAAPYFIGSQIESTVRQQAESGDQYLKDMVITNPYIQNAGLQLQGYEKSYLNSKAQGLLRFETVIPDENNQPMAFDIPFTSTIKHGPYLGSAGFGLAHIISRLDTTQLENLPEAITADTLLIEDTIGFSGAVDEIITVAPVQFETADGGTINFSGSEFQLSSHINNRMNYSGQGIIQSVQLTPPDSDALTLQPFEIELQGSGDPDTRSGQYQFQSSQLQLEGPENIRITIQEIASKGTFSRLETANFPLGESELRVSHIEVNAPAALPAAVKLPELTIKGVAVANENSDSNIDMQIQYNATLDASLTQALQVPVDFKTAALTLEMNSMDTAVLQEYMQLTNSLSLSAQNPDAIEAMLDEKMPAMLQSLIDQSSQFIAAFKATSDEGGLDARLDVSFKPNLQMTEQDVRELLNSPDTDPARVLNMLNGTGYIDLDKSVTDKAGLTPMVQMMAADFVVLEDEKFKSTLAIQDGQLLVNDQAIPLSPAAPGMLPEDEPSQALPETEPETPAADEPAQALPEDTEATEN